MTSHPTTPAILVLLSLVFSASAASAQTAPTLDETIAPGRNYDKAEFRLWLPAGAARIRAVLALMPGSNGDARSSVDDPVWQALATRQHLALVGCRFTDKPHDQAFIEEYVNVSLGSGQAFLDALSSLAKRSTHPELASAPLLLWGMSAGGQFNYEFAAWKPERVIAFIVNKGGIYYSALVNRSARGVPGMLFVGGKDLEFRTNTIAGLFAVNRRAGALWAFAEEPDAAHEVGRSRDLAVIFFEDILPLRLPETGSDGRGAIALKPLVASSGYLGDLKARTFQPQGQMNAPGVPTAWLPTERVAKAWQAMLTGRPFDPPRAITSSSDRRTLF